MPWRTSGPPTSTTCGASGGFRAGRKPEGSAALRESVAIVGYMGCGKSTVGRLLAGRLGVGFVDL
ncbi:hypothetical protein J0689_27865, partial [Vibrio parahaemolyticus]|nr:hypothetical protein [Vibrio parahaemolyticus]